jgi:hypothetical protein
MRELAEQNICTPEMKPNGIVTLSLLVQRLHEEVLELRGDISLARGRTGEHVRSEETLAEIVGRMREKIIELEGQPVSNKELRGYDEELHAAVNLFAIEMKDRLFEKAQEGREGWDCESDREFFKEMIGKCAAKGNWIDVANFSLFLWYLDKDFPRRK